MPDEMPREYIGKAPVEVVLAGRTYRVGPITMGQLYLLKQVFRSIDPPQPVKVEVSGLVQAMMQGPDGQENTEGPKIPGLRQMEAEKWRQTLKDTVLQAVREARGRIEQWPPDPASALGQDLIANDRRVQPEFVRIMLQKHHPEVTAEQAAAILEDCEVTEYQDLMDAAFTTIYRRTERLITERLDDPKLTERMEKARKIQALTGNNSGGDGAGFLLQS
jgi:hypothetical protein